MWDNVNMCQNECWVKKLQKDTYNAVSYSLKTVLCIAMGTFVNTVVSIKMYVEAQQSHSIPSNAMLRCPFPIL